MSCFFPLGLSILDFLEKLFSFFLPPFPLPFTDSLMDSDSSSSSSTYTLMIVIMDLHFSNTSITPIDSALSDTSPRPFLPCSSPAIVSSLFMINSVGSPSTSCREAKLFSIARSYGNPSQGRSSSTFRNWFSL